MKIEISKNRDVSTTDKLEFRASLVTVHAHTAVAAAMAAAGARLAGWMW